MFGESIHVICGIRTFARICKRIAKTLTRLRWHLVAKCGSFAGAQLYLIIHLPFLSLLFVLRFIGQPNGAMSSIVLIATVILQTANT